MKPSFVAYVDESGDEGFLFKPDGSGSSRWLVLSAVVIRKVNDLQVVDCLKAVRSILGKPPLYPLHFVDLKHEQRIPYVRRVGGLPIRTVTVLIYKPLVREPEKFQTEKHLLYRYASRLLLERVSWLCRDHRREGEGDGFAEVIFSNRSAMSYDDLREYVALLLERSKAASEVQLDATVIAPERIRSVEHSKLAGLQAADAVASALHFAVKRNRYGEVEPAYAPHLRRTLFRHKSTLIGYGLKFWPGTLDEIKREVPEAESLGDLQFKGSQEPRIPP
ncbi:MAG: DUF3800 domain-containing protein [Candidatus Sumerlaeia bacterium]|nr:DUF3800 domain-containing protein [Candidatus Sumerlaeia bacterium]